MKHAIRYVMIFSGLSLLSITQPAHAEYKCDQKFLSQVDAKACAAAAQGADSLRQFLSRTRGVYGLQIADYARFEDEATTSSAAPPAEAKARKQAVSATAPTQ